MFMLKVFVLAVKIETLKAVSTPNVCETQNVSEVIVWGNLSTGGVSLIDCFFKSPIDYVAFCIKHMHFLYSF